MELKFVGAEEMLATIEVDTNDDYDVAVACEDAIATALPLISRASRATVYVFEGPSINFGRQTNSIWFAIAGTERVLTHLHAVLNGVAGADVRFGEYIPARRCVPRMHLENGTVWRPAVDSDEWEVSGQKQR